MGRREYSQSSPSDSVSQKYVPAYPPDPNETPKRVVRFADVPESNASYRPADEQNEGFAARAQSGFTYSSKDAVSTTTSMV